MGLTLAQGLRAVTRSSPRLADQGERGCAPEVRASVTSLAALFATAAQG